MAASEFVGATDSSAGEIAPIDSNVVPSGRDPLYLLACHLAWQLEQDLHAYQEVLAALDDCDPSIRTLAEHLLHRASPRPEPKVKSEDEV